MRTRGVLSSFVHSMALPLLIVTSNSQPCWLSATAAGPDSTAAQTFTLNPPLDVTIACICREPDGLRQICRYNAEIYALLC